MDTKIGSTSIQSGFKRGYDDLNEHLEKLKKSDLLWVIDEPINKDKHLHPFVRWGFVGDVGSVLTNNPKRAFYSRMSPMQRDEDTKAIATLWWVARQARRKFMRRQWE
jgi:hypothetical protein